MSVFCLEEEPCQERPVIREGARVVVRVCIIVNEGCRVAMRIDPFEYLHRCVSPISTWREFGLTYPIANVRQSADGAIAVMGS